MLSKEAENFLLNLRLELISRGKNEKDIQEMEEELRDHLTEAEANGQRIESITGGSVKDYIRSISQELPREKGLIKNGILFIIYMLGVFTIPRLISGDFELNTSVIFYNLGILAIGILGTLLIVKNVARRYGDSKKAYIIIGSFSMFFFLAMVGGQFIIRNYSGIILAESNPSVNLIIGAILLSVFIVGALIMKKWFFAALILLISLPEIIAKIVTNGSGPQNESYLIISGIVLIIVNITVIGFLIYSSKKEDKKTSN
ncbi:hypothetical protein [Oceanobacillus sojae]|uniref:hypothetical protein n=1 Tax=Oceanobacillus sojae TaxID=582851 RepID=UPI0021A3F3BC|nr:hypothetical protein [Oceanobacillus sojae]MCT1905014.1 hypothetical protein [Oceanobacillus sojae]